MSKMLSSFYFKLLSVATMVFFTSSCVPAMGPMNADDTTTADAKAAEEDKKKNDEEDMYIIIGGLALLLVIVATQTGHNSGRIDGLHENENSLEDSDDSQTDVAGAWRLTRPSTQE